MMEYLQTGLFLWTSGFPFKYTLTLCWYSVGPNLAFCTALVCCSTASTRCQKVLLHIDMQASHSCCRFISCAFMMSTSPSIFLRPLASRRHFHPENFCYLIVYLFPTIICKPQRCLFRKTAADQQFLKYSVHPVINNYACLTPTCSQSWEAVVPVPKNYNSHFNTKSMLKEEMTHLSTYMEKHSWSEQGQLIVTLKKC